MVEIYKEIKNSINIEKNRVAMNEKGNFITIIRDNQILKMPIKIIAENNNDYIVKNTFNSGDLLLLDNISNNINLSNTKLNIIQ